MTSLNISHKQPTRLKNGRCAYCNADLSKEPRDLEHVIGRKFVPRGSFNQQWNLHLNSCKPCNRIKADLENDISAITMIPGPFEENLSGDTLSREATRKSKTKSMKTGLPVAESQEKFNIKTTFGAATFNFGFISPPQMESERVFALARYHLAGFHFFISYDRVENIGYLWPGGYFPLVHVDKNDWGNEFAQSFSQVTRDWDYRLAVPTANGHFMALIKKHPTEALWSWALEWNKNTRVIGFYGDQNVAKSLVDQFEKLRADRMDDGKGNAYFRRIEKPLPDDNEDTLFYYATNS